MQFLWNLLAIIVVVSSLIVSSSCSVVAQFASSTSHPFPVRPYATSGVNPRKQVPIQKETNPILPNTLTPTSVAVPIHGLIQSLTCRSLALTPSPKTSPIDTYSAERFLNSHENKNSHTIKGTGTSAREITRVIDKNSDSLMWQNPPILSRRPSYAPKRRGGDRNGQ